MKGQRERQGWCWLSPLPAPLRSLQPLSTLLFPKTRLVFPATALSLSSRSNISLRRGSPRTTDKEQS